MTFQTDQIQAMIAAIDEVLNQAGGFGLGWLKSKDSQERRVLEQVKHNLQILQQQQVRSATSAAMQSSHEANQTAQLQRAKAELQALGQRRQALKKEIQQLEQQRENYLSQSQASVNEQTKGEGAIAEFFQALMGSLQESLTPQIAQTLSNLETEFLIDKSIDSVSNQGQVTNITSSPELQEQAEHLKKQQARLGRLLKTLDRKLNLMFETLQVNLEKYQTSFSQGIEKMHNLGEESEAMLAALIDNLEQELQQAAVELEPSQALDTPAETTVVQPNPVTPVRPLSNQLDADDIPLPYAGFEWMPSADPAGAAFTTGGDRQETEKADSDALEINPRAATGLEGSLYAGLAALVAQTDTITSHPTQSLQFDSDQISDLETPDTISSLTDLIDTGLTETSNPQEVLREADPLDPHSQVEPGNEIPSADPFEEPSLNRQQDDAFLEEEQILSGDVPTTAASTADEEELSLIPDDILAEFDELFGVSTQESSGVGSNTKAILTEDQTAAKLDKGDEKKKLATTEKRRKTVTTDRDFSLSLNTVSTSRRCWYLGIDCGTTGISAVLLNAKTRQLYPITWSIAGSDRTNPVFRLPAEVYLFEEGGDATVSISADAEGAGILLKNFKQYLKVGIPYKSSETGNWKPVLQQSKNQFLALNSAVKALEILLSTIKTETKKEKYLISAVGLESETLKAAFNELAGAIANCPADWSEAYRFNVREAILRANIVESAEKIGFVESAIASTLAQLVKANVTPTGDTLIIHAGATTTELGLVEIPANIAELSHSHFACRSFPYAGNFIDQDIICQLLLKKEIVNQLVTKNSTLEMPQKGEPDLAIRYRLQQQLESSRLGKILLEAANHLKLNLQHQDSSTLEIDGYRWVLQRQTLENLVYSPFIQCLNRELNALLVREGVSVESIRQVICTGDTTQIDAIAPWLQQKLPNASLIQHSEENAIALGLAALPLYPEVLDAPRHQYGEYFLLLELLRTLHEQPLTLGKITQMLHRQGINTSACQQRILAFLAGYLPAGIVPSDAEALMLTETSLPVLAFASSPLFYKEDNQTYRLDASQSASLRHYFNAVLESTRQKFEEPLGVYWLTPTE